MPPAQLTNVRIPSMSWREREGEREEKKPLEGWAKDAFSPRRKFLTFQNWLLKTNFIKPWLS